MQGWIGGYPDGTFRPATVVNKAEAIKMLLEVFDVALKSSLTAPFSDVLVSEWYSNYIYTAKTMRLLEETGSYYLPGNSITRGGVSENIYRLLSQISL